MNRSCLQEPLLGPRLLGPGVQPLETKECPFHSFFFSFLVCDSHFRFEVPSAVFPLRLYSGQGRAAGRGQRQEAQLKFHSQKI